MLKRLLFPVMLVQLIVCPALAESPSPRIVVQAPVYDFGSVMQGDAVEHSFVFRNEGDALLVIDRVKSTCGCTGVLLTEKNIPAGGEGTVKATFNSSHFRGQVHKQILLYSNDPSGQPVTMEITGTVVAPLEVEPSRLSLGDVIIGAEKTVTTTLHNRSDAPLRLVNLRTSNPAFRAEADRDTLEPNGSTELHVIARPDGKTAHLRGEVLIRIDRSGIGEIRVPVNGRIVPAE